tara:strand:- start:159 stop:314 length:156 start_codon:yes stop_codon:yes gene_type:complete
MYFRGLEHDLDTADLRGLQHYSVKNDILEDYNIILHTAINIGGKLKFKKSY